MIIIIAIHLYMYETSVYVRHSLINLGQTSAVFLPCLAFLAAEFASSFASLNAALLATRTSYFIALTATFNSTPCHALMDAIFSIPGQPLLIPSICT